MFIIDMLSWWYTVGWKQRIVDVAGFWRTWTEYFGFGTLLRTLFKPWKQIVAAPGSHASFQAKKSALMDNLMSRLVGFSVRSGVLVFGGIMMAGLFVLRIAYVALWPLIPAMPLIVVVIAGVL